MKSDFIICKGQRRFGNHALRSGEDGHQPGHLAGGRQLWRLRGESHPADAEQAVPVPRQGGQPAGRVKAAGDGQRNYGKEYVR